MVNQLFLLALNHLLGTQSWARRELAPFAGNTAKIVAPPFRLLVLVTRDGTLAEGSTERVDAEFELPAAAALTALQGRQALIRSVRVSGSADFAEVFGQVMRELRWDYEEDLSRVLGDVAAHRVAMLLQKIGAWPRAAGQNLAENVSEYLREEQAVLASRPGAERFVDTVRSLESALEGLESRIRRMEDEAGRP